MGDSLRYKDWFEKAAHDLRGAEILMEHDGGNDLVAFHCQQAMEKSPSDTTADFARRI